MASAGLKKELECSICLSLYTDPVTLRCGHNFCRVCIDQHLNTQDESGVYSCPECREEFQERPVLQRNITLRNVVERVLSTEQHEEDVPGIFCTYCIHSPVPAVKSCLMCEASLCDNHLKVHSKGPEHVLTDPSTKLEKRKCSIHNELLKYYCAKDDTCICVSCSLAGEHQRHQVEMLDEASEKKKRRLRNILQKLVIKREETEERVQSLKDHWRKVQEKTPREEERVSALFIDLRRQIYDLEKKVLSEISRQEEQQSLSLSDVIQRMEIKKDKLSKKMMHIEELCNMTDPLTVLQDPDTGDLYDPEKGEGDEDTGGHDKTYDVDVDGITGMLHAGFADIMICAGDGVNYRQGPADILLDVNTASNHIRISDDMKTATWTRKTQNHPKSEERFQGSQVMSINSFSSGRHYWDVEVSGSYQGRVGMCYPSIDRRGDKSYIGYNNKSWCLCGERLVCNNQCSVLHEFQAIEIPPFISGPRVRIYLDYEAGQLSFYELCDPIRHLHTFSATFTEPLHAVLWVFKGYIKILEGEKSWDKFIKEENFSPKSLVKS
ncbi:E3 ubiquitin/ISG15 ligase TRIM25-like [Leptodactylus fuscus]|uniref:E3 ubiquitin/ISG15 ligase TRIM25-like n=1 Tax=Leptodactylus fuscus TaxID=238119 RepID=UPI003F4F0A87